MLACVRVCVFCVCVYNMANVLCDMWFHIYLVLGLIYAQIVNLYQMRFQSNRERVSSSVGRILQLLLSSISSISSSSSEAEKKAGAAENEKQTG